MASGLILVDVQNAYCPGVQKHFPDSFHQTPPLGEPATPMPERSRQPC
jgi:hypothetical protein